MGQNAMKKTRNEIRKSENIARMEQLRADRAYLTPAQKIEALDFRLGKGVGAVKERKRLKEEMLHGKKKKEALPPSQPPITKTVEAPQIVEEVTETPQNVDKKTGRKILVPLVKWVPPNKKKSA